MVNFHTDDKIKQIKIGGSRMVEWSNKGATFVVHKGSATRAATKWVTAAFWGHQYR